MGADGDVSSMTGAQMERTASPRRLIPSMRPEDGAWDPANRERLLLRHDQRPAHLTSRLWRLRFNDMRNPAAGGTIRIISTGRTADSAQMFDNICIDRRGRILLQEDPGNKPYIAKVWLYGIDTGQLFLESPSTTRPCSTQLSRAS